MLARSRTARDEFFFYDNDSHTAEHLRTKMRTILFPDFSCDFLLLSVCFRCVVLWCCVSASECLSGVVSVVCVFCDLRKCLT